MPLAAWNPATSSASVNGRMRMVRGRFRRRRRRPCAVKTIAPLAAPGDAATPRDDRRVWHGGVEGGVQERVERARVDRRDRLGAREQPLLDRIHGEPHGGLCGPLGGARLQHVQAAFLDRELGVLHVAVVALERAQDVPQQSVHRGHPLGELGEVARRAHSGDHVLALGVDQEVSARLRRARDLVT